jgi:hypothetical protein
VTGVVVSSIQPVEDDGPPAVNLVDGQGSEVARFTHGLGAGLWVETSDGMAWLSSHEADRLARFIMASPNR